MQKKYKPSIFNIKIPIDNKQNLVYNTLTTSLIAVNDDYYNRYIDKTGEGNDTEALTKMGFIVDSECNEIEILKRTWEKALSNIKDEMTSIIIAPTMACNANCYYCFEHIPSNLPNARMAFPRMSKQVQDNIISFISLNCNNSIKIHWFGGEPLIAANEISYMIDSLKNKGVDVISYITTNGSLIDSDMLQKFHEWNVRKIQITIDDIGEKYNEIKKYNRKGINTDYFTIVINNIKKILNYGIRVNLRVNFDPSKISSTKNTIEYLTSKFKEYDNCYIYAAPITDNNIIPVTEEFEGEHPYYSLIKLTESQERFKFKVVSENGENVYQDAIHDSLYTVKDRRILLLKKHMLCPIPLPCMAVAKWSYTIDPMGQLFKCHRLLGKGDTFSAGRIIENGVVDINHNFYDYFEKIDFPYEECLECVVAPLCMGGCKANRILYSKGQTCCHVKAIVKNLIMDYYGELKRM